jgi:hypothetical protein
MRNEQNINNKKDDYEDFMNKKQNINEKKD